MGVMLSTNAGTSWTSSRISAPAGSEATVAAFAPGDSKILYVGGRSGSYAPLAFRSTNGGAGWTNITGGLQAPPNAIAVDPQEPNVVYVANNEGLWRSANGGTTWAKCALPNSPWGLRAVVINKNNPNQVFAGHMYGVAYSQDRGLTWTDISQGLTVPYVNGLDFNPVNKTLYVGTAGGGLWKRPM